MGCDIHVYLEKKVKVNDELKWVNCDYYQKNEYYEEYSGDDSEKEFNIVQFYGERSYTLFGILAGVRDGYNIQISEPKGLPDDVTPEVKSISDYWGSDAHSHSYLTINEIYDFLRAVPITKQSSNPNDNPLKRFLDKMITRYEDEFWNFEGTKDENGDYFRVVFWFDN